jgi:hypothetical protein
MNTTTATPGQTIRTGTGDNGTTYRLRFHDGATGGMGLYIGTGRDSVCVSEVWDADNFEYAVEMADEEMRVLRAQCRAEFGY